MESVHFYSSNLMILIETMLPMLLNLADISDTETPFLDLHLSISKDLFHLKFMISAITLILI